MFRLNTNIDKKERSVISMRNFKGLDTVHSPMNLSYQHAVDMRNLINRNGVNRKRKGWKQVWAFPDNAIAAGSWSGEVEFDPVQEIKKVILHFYYVKKDGSADEYYLRAKCFIFENGEYTEIENLWEDVGYTQSLTVDVSIVYFEKVLSIATGKTLLVGDFVFLNNEYAFRIIPIGEDLAAPFLPTVLQNNIDIDKVRYGDAVSSVDDLVNIAAKSSFFFDYEYPTTSSPDYDTSDTSLDSAVPASLLTSEKIGKANILNPNEKVRIVLNLTDEMLTKLNENGSIITSSYFPDLKGYNCGITDSQTSDSVTLAYISERDSYYSEIRVDSFLNGRRLDAGHMTFQFTDKHQAEDGESLIYEVYTANTGGGPSDPYEHQYMAFAGKILTIEWVHFLNFLKSDFLISFQAGDEIALTLEFGRRGHDISKFKPSLLTLFGTGGNPNRLFYSDGSSTVYYSEYRNPRYIGEENTITLGSTPITGWIKGTEESLYVFKKYSRQEESLYVITGELTTSEENQYGVDEGEAVFRNKGYALPESAVNQYAVCSLANDVLIVSNDGVYGVTLSANVASTERFARSRAEQIRNLLKTHDLTKAKCVVWDNKMFMTVDGLVFVADARFRASFDGDMTDTFNYEWWLWDNMPVKYWVVMQDKLCFVSEDNRLCTFYDGFSDYISDDLLVAVVDGNNVTISNSYAEYNKIALNAAYRVCIDPADITGIVDGALVLNTEKLYTSINEGDTVYFDVTSGALTSYPVAAETPYMVESINIMCGQVKFTKEDGTTVAFTSAMDPLLASNPLRISKAANNEYDMKIDASAASDNTQITDSDGNEVQLIEYNGVSSYSATIFKKKPVVAYWQTGSYDFGSSMYSKTMERFSVAFDRESPKKLKLYYTTAWNGGDRLFKDLKKNADFDFDAFSFLQFTFDQRFETSYTRRLLIRNFNFIAFRLFSDDAEDFSVDSMSFVYKINKLNRGEH